jgi:hypothetical protein
MSTFTIDLNFADANPHQVALYMLDWDGQRSQRVEIVDASNRVLDSRTVSGFNAGQYLVWNLTGDVTIRVVNTGSNAVVSGLFFGGAAAAGQTSAVFVKSDAAAGGTWKGAYGAAGYNVIGNAASYPSFVTVKASGNASYVWDASTGETRALQKAASSWDRIAGCWYNSTSFTVDLQFNDAATHELALYFLDWDFGSRTERIEILNAANNQALDTRNVSAFAGGRYLVWNVRGHVIVRITNTNPYSNAVLGGIFFK